MSGTKTKRIYQSSLIKPKRRRRTAEQLEVICTELRALLLEYHPMTVRQVFYQLVSRGVIEKTEREYDNTVGRLLTKMRRDGRIPYGWIADNTRWMRKPRTFASMQGMLNLTAETYRRAIWNEQPAYVEIWLEKDALAGVLMEETIPWDVPLMVTRGYASLSYLHEAAETIAEQGKPAFLYYFGDYDPSGVDIPRKVEKTLRELAPSAEIHFQRMAVTEEQILEFNLPTRPTKATDSRSKSFGRESVEVDAIPPKHLREIAQRCIVQHVDKRIHERTMAIEQQELETLARISQNWPAVSGFVRQ